MLARPKTLDVFGYFLIAVALSFPLQVMVIYGHGFSEWFSVLAKLTLINWMVITCAVFNGILVFRAAPVLKYTLPLMICLMAVNNWIVGTWHVDFSKTQTLFASAGFLVAHGVLLQKPIIALFLHPEKRWWLRAPRKQVEIQAFVSPFNGSAFKAKTFDLSENGVFIPLCDNPGKKQKGTHDANREGNRDGNRDANREGNREGNREENREGNRDKKINVNDRMSLCLTLGLAQIRCDARVVRSVEAKGAYPAGIGIAFDGLGRRQLRELRRYIEVMA